MRICYKTAGVRPLARIIQGFGIVKRKNELLKDKSHCSHIGRPVAADIHSDGGHSPPYEAVEAHRRPGPRADTWVRPYRRLIIGIGSLGSGVDPVDEAGEGDGLPNVVEAAEPGHQALDAHPEAAVGHAAVAPEVQVPLQGLLGQVMLLDAA